MSPEPKSASLSWDEYFMSLAVLVSLRSKDPSTKVGAVLVRDRKIVGTGYNGFPSGCDESLLPWTRDRSLGWLNTKYPYVIHSEANALLNSIASTRECSIYVTLYPCNECAKLLIQGGVREVIYADNKHGHLDEFKASSKLFEVTGVKVRQFPVTNINVAALVKAFDNLTPQSDP